jgi:hypothetical protein
MSAPRSQDAGIFLEDPLLNADWSTYATDAALQSRYAVLGAMGPDVFYAMLDYGGGIQQLEDTVLKLAGTFRCVGQLSSQLNNLIDSGLNDLTEGLWDDIQTTFSRVNGILTGAALDLLIDRVNPWSFFLPLRQVDDFQNNWYWADFLHYVKTGCFTQKLLDNAAALNTADPGSATSKCLSAYALGYLTHYIADTVGHGWVNRIVESPYRNHWQRHHTCENFIDAHVWASWHNKGAEAARPADEDNLDVILGAAADPLRDGAARYTYARLNDLCNIGSAGIDPFIDRTLNEICKAIQNGLFKMGASSVPTMQRPDDPIFATWAQFVADAMRQTYPSGQMHPSRMGRYPTADDIAGAYGAFRLLLSLATEDDVEPPMPPMTHDPGAVLDQMWKDITSDLSMIPPPPSVAGSGGSFSLDALWNAIKAELKWLGEVAEAALKALGDAVKGLIKAGAAVAADIIEPALYLLNSILYSAYHSLRMALVMSGYAGPFTEDLTAVWAGLDLTTLWNTGVAQTSPRYPLEPMVSQRDLLSDSSHPFSPYRPYFVPSTMAPVNVELPATTFPAEVLAWSMPEDMLDSQVVMTDDMFSRKGPAPRALVPLLNTDGTTLTSLESFDGSKRYFGSIMANCERALTFAVPYLLGHPYPKSVVLPDYNMDSDRGYAWPCWDVDWAAPAGSITPFPWNGCDPYPLDTAARVNATPGISWGDGPRPRTAPGSGITVNDPFGSPRSGTSFVNAIALSTPGKCEYEELPFPSIVVNPKPGSHHPNNDAFPNLDGCGLQEKDIPVVDDLPAPALPAVPKVPGGGLLSTDYRFADGRFLHSDLTNAAVGDQGDVVHVYRRLPYPTTPPTEKENDGRLSDFLRALARSVTPITNPPPPPGGPTVKPDPKIVLANAVSLWLGGGSTALAWEGVAVSLAAKTPPDDFDRARATAVAQLAVTGRAMFNEFAAWNPDDAALRQTYDQTTFPGGPFTVAEVDDAVTHVLDAAYSALWAIRSNDPAWRYQRSSLGWIAVSGFDDTPHRPVNVPTAPYPQYDLDVDVAVPGTSDTFPVTTRYLVASAGAWIGPSDKGLSFVQPNDPNAAAMLGTPPTSGPTGPVPRTVPTEPPVAIPGNKIILYIHGGGSKAEEAIDMANWFILEGAKTGDKYSVISLDLPNSAYGSTFDLTKVTGASYDYLRLDVLNCVVQYVIGFVEALDAAVGNVKDRIVAVMGGSLGGNTTMRLIDLYDPTNRPYLRTIVSWSVTATAPAKYAGLVPAAWVAAHIGHLTKDAFSPEPQGDHLIESQYIEAMYTVPLGKGALFTVLPIPPQPILWFRGGYKDGDGLGWQPCKDVSVARSRFDRYEIYTPAIRHWITALDLEQITISFQDQQPVQMGPDARLMLVAGDNDNYFPNAIYNSTIKVAGALRDPGSGKVPAQGKAEFWLDTGHSIHSERPHQFVQEILYFLDHPDAGDSPNGVVVSTPPMAEYSRTDG